MQFLLCHVPACAWTRSSPRQIDSSEWPAELHLVSSVLHFSSLAAVKKDVYSECSGCVSVKFYLLHFILQNGLWGCWSWCPKLKLSCLGTQTSLSKESCLGCWCYCETANNLWSSWSFRLLERLSSHLYSWSRDLSVLVPGICCLMPWTVSFHYKKCSWQFGESRFSRMHVHFSNFHYWQWGFYSVY